MFGATRDNSDDFDRRDPFSGHTPRTSTRQAFCQEVAEEADTIRKQLVADPNWRRLCNHSGKSSAIRNEPEKKEMRLGLAAVQPVDIMKRKLRPQAKNSDPLLVVQFHEASTLIEAQEEDQPPEPNTARYIALNRIISCLKHLPVWFFFLSTDSKIRLLVPPDHQPSCGSALTNNSARLTDGLGAPDRLLKRFPPFHLLLASTLRTASRCTPLPTALRSAPPSCARALRSSRSRAISPSSGAPLWSGYRDNPARLARAGAAESSSGGGQAPVGALRRARNRDQVLAVLSFPPGARCVRDECARAMPAVGPRGGARNMRVVARARRRRGASCHRWRPSEPRAGARRRSSCSTRRRPTGG
jgi:hypothetical protein